MPEAFVGCGSNIDPEQNLKWALSELRKRFGELSCSSVYRSPAFGFEGPDFLNLVVGFQTDASADAVEAELSALETERGRNQGGRSGSRTLDLDLLLFDARVDPARRLPRADILRYPFVLVPLAEIYPTGRHPVTGISYQSAVKAGASSAASLSRVADL